MVLVEEKVIITNSKGMKLSGILHKPANISRKKVPAVVILHGFTGYKEETHLESLAHALEKNGIIALRIDFSGSGESEGSFEKDYEVENHINDALSAVKYLKESGFTDEKNIFLWGHSMGAQLAFWAAEREKSIKGICAISGVKDAENAKIWKRIDEIKKKGFFEKTSTKLGAIKIPYESFKKRENYGLGKILGVVKQPKLIIWGTADEVVPPTETEKVFLECMEPKEKLVIEGMGHDYKKYPAFLEKVNEKTIEFIEKHSKK